jgi:hypothetical protein
VAAWPMVARGQIAKTVMPTAPHGFALELIDMPPLRRLTRDAIDR